MGEARGKTVYMAFMQKGTHLRWMDPREENGRPNPEEKMLIKFIKEIQEENKSKADADNSKGKADTNTWSPGGQKPEGQNTRRHQDASQGTRDKGQLVYTTQDVTLKKNSLN